MELLVATWTLRISLLASVVVGAVSMSVGTTVIEAVDRSVIAAFAFTFLGRQLIGWLETPEQRRVRRRAQREAARAGGKTDKAGKGRSLMAHPVNSLETP
jgi:hypothetical protein